MSLWLTDASFGLVALRIGMVSRWAALALGSLLVLTAVGGPGFTTGPFAALIEPLTLGGIVLVGIGRILLGLGGIVLVGIGWILLGIEVATRRRSSGASSRVDPASKA